MQASLGTILDFYPESSNLKLRFDKTSSLSFRSWGRRALASDQSQAIKLVNISQLVHFSNTIRCGNPAENKGSGLETEPPVSVTVLIRCLTDHI